MEKKRKRLPSFLGAFQKFLKDARLGQGEPRRRVVREVFHR